MGETGIFVGIPSYNNADTIVFDAIAASGEQPESVINGMIPLWLGRSYFFVKQTLKIGYSWAEKVILGQARLFFKNRKYLIEKMKE